MVLHSHENVVGSDTIFPPLIELIWCCGLAAHKTTRVLVDFKFLSLNDPLTTTSDYNTIHLLQSKCKKAKHKFPKEIAALNTPENRTRNV